MPGVSVSKELLFKKIGNVQFSDEEFDELCFQFGIELDDVTVSEDGKTTTYKLDIGANRYDLLCVEGVSRSLSAFLNKSQPPIYKTISPKQVIKTFVDPAVENIRPFVVTAILRAVHVNQAVYTSLLDLQEKLHHNLCRKRTLVAIGVHDLSTLTPPFKYTVEAPSSIKFKALNQTKEQTAAELMELYKNDLHLKPYLGIIDKFDKYPVIRDAKGVVLSMPPIINGEHSKLTSGEGVTLDLFIECTATDEGKAITVLDTLVAMMSEHCQKKFEVELTEVVYEKETKVFPVMEYREQLVDVDKANQVVGVSLSAETIAKNLTRMSLSATVDSPNTVKVSIPPTRHDILHVCDIYEDIAISFGYDNIPISLPPTMTIARQFPLNKLTDMLRSSTAMCGWTEALPFSLCSIEDECEKLRVSRDIRMKDLALISNPKTVEFQTARYSLLPGVLKTVQFNKKMPLPIKLFEIGDVVRVTKDPSADTGCVNQRNFCAIYYNKSPGFELIHGLLDRIMEQLEVKDCTIVSRDNPSYFDGRCADIVYQEKVIGQVGVLHPEVCKNFDLINPVSCVEFCIEPFL